MAQASPPASRPPPLRPGALACTAPARGLQAPYAPRDRAAARRGRVSALSQRKEPACACSAAQRKLQRPPRADAQRCFPARGVTPKNAAAAPPAARRAGADALGGSARARSNLSPGSVFPLLGRRALSASVYTISAASVCPLYSSLLACALSSKASSASAALAVGAAGFGPGAEPLHCGGARCGAGGTRVRGKQQASRGVRRAGARKAEQTAHRQLGAVAASQSNGCPRRKAPRRVRRVTCKVAHAPARALLRRRPSRTPLLRHLPSGPPRGCARRRRRPCARRARRAPLPLPHTQAQVRTRAAAEEGTKARIRYSRPLEVPSRPLLARVPPSGRRHVEPVRRARGQGAG